MFYNFAMWCNLTLYIYSCLMNHLTVPCQIPLRHGDLPPPSTAMVATAHTGQQLILHEPATSLAKIILINRVYEVYGRLLFYFLAK